jgi:hypothetical protein
MATHSAVGSEFVDRRTLLQVAVALAAAGPALMREGHAAARLNKERPIRRLGVTRRALLEELDRPHLKALPSEPYVFAEWRLRRVGIDYRVEVEAHFYSVPYRFALTQLGLSGMAQAFTELENSGDGATLTHADWLGLLVDREVTHRRDKRLAARRVMPGRATTPSSRTSITGPRAALDRALFHSLTAGEWIDAHEI